MINGSLKIGGGTIFWRPATWFNRQKLKDNLELIGFEALLPSERQPLPCLRSALSVPFKGRDYTITTLKGGEGLEVHKVEHISEESNEFHSVCVAKLLGNDANGNPRVGIRPFDPELAHVIVGAFNTARGLIGGDSVTELFVKYLHSLGATTLRPSGGFYWLPEERLLAWEKLAHAVEPTATHGTCSCYVLKNVMDADAIKAVGDAIAAEVLAESQKIYEEVTGGELGPRALENRKAQSEILAQKVMEYERILGVTLSSLLESCERSRSAAAAAEMLQSATVE
jgi:hypothetical protein